MKIEPAGDRKHMGRGGGGKGERRQWKQNVFPFSFFLSVSFLFCFFSALRDHSRALTKLSKIRRISVNSLDFFNLFNLSHVVYETNCLSLTTIHRKFADHRLSLRVKTRHRPTSNPIKKLMSRDDIRSELWVQFVSWRNLGTATAPHRIPRQSICGTFTKGCIIICLRKDIFLWNVCILLLFSEWKSGENYLLSKWPCNAKSELTCVNIIVGDNASILNCTCIIWTGVCLELDLSSIK